MVDPTGSPEVTIVGIVGNTRNAGLREATAATMLVPYTLVAPPGRTLALRTAGDPALLVNLLRREIQAMDPEQPLGRPITLDEILAQQVVQPRFTMALFSAFGALGLALAAAGIYSVLSFSVARRTPELGLRMALGAPRGHVLGLTLRNGLRLVAIGLGVGILVSLAATRALRSQLVGITPADPAAYAAVALLLAAVALAACYLPARRAASVDPLTALREE
jgi:putative ABC transport system permease protein